MKILDLGEFEAQIGLIVRDKDNPNNYALIRFEDLEEIIKFYNSFKKEFKKLGESTRHRKITDKKKRRTRNEVR